MVYIKSKLLKIGAYQRQVINIAAARSVSSLAVYLYIPIMVSLLSKVEFGKISLGIGVVSLFITLDAGIANSIRNDITKYLATNRKLRLNFLIGNTFRILLYIGAIVATLSLAAYLAYFIIYYEMNRINLVNYQHVFIILLLSLLVVVNSATALWNGVHQQSTNAYFRAGANITFLVSLSIIVLGGVNCCDSFEHIFIAYLIIFNCYLILSIAKFFNKFPQLKPLSYKPVKNSRLIKRGIQFFIIQVAAIILFSTDKVFVAYLFDLETVSDYEVIYRLLSLPYIAHAMIVGPLWAIFNEFNSKGQHKAIVKILINQLLIFITCSIACGVIVMFLGDLSKIWVGDVLNMHGPLKLWTGVLLVVMMWNNLFAMYLNGSENLQIVVIISALSIIANPLMNLLFAAYFNLGPAGVSIASVVCLVPVAVVGPIILFKKIRSIR